MSVTVTPEAEARIRRLIDSGEYPDAAAVIDRALQALDDERQTRFERLRALVLAGRDSGPAIELTDEVWDEIEREAEAAYLRGEEPPPYFANSGAARASRGDR